MKEYFPLIDFARVAPPTLVTLYVGFISTYGAVILTTLTIAYAVVNLYFRAREHKARMLALREKDDGGI